MYLLAYLELFRVLENVCTNFWINFVQMITKILLKKSCKSRLLPHTNTRISLLMMLRINMCLVNLFPSTAHTSCVQWQGRG